MSPTDRRRLLLVAAAALVLRLTAALVTEVKPIFPAFYYTDARMVEDAAAEGFRARSEGRPFVYLGSLSQRVQVFWQLTLYRAAGPRPIVGKALNSILGAAGVLALGFALAPEFGSAAVAAAALAAVWPSNVFYGSQNFKEAPSNLLAYGALAGGLPLLVTAAVLEPAPLLAAAAGACLLAAGFYRAYVLLALSASLGAAALLSLRDGRRRAPAYLLAAIFAALGLYRPATRIFLDRAYTGGTAEGDPRLSPQLWPVTIDQHDSTVSYSPTSPEGLSKFREVRQTADRVWAEQHMGREIGTQIYPDARFKDWFQVAAFVPKGAFAVLFQPLPGFYPLEGKLGRWLAAAENTVLFALALLGAGGFARGPKSPARLALAAFFACMVVGASLLEFDLGSAGRHKLLYFPMLFPFAAEELSRLLGRKERE